MKIASIFSDKLSLKNIGLLFLRITIGASFLVHGFPKISGGVDKWRSLGNAISHIGISSFPVFWGFMASMSEFFGGFLLIIGLLIRPSSIMLSFTMLVATFMHLSKGAGYAKISHPLELLFVFITLAIAGGGHYSLDAFIKRKRDRKS